MPTPDMAKRHPRYRSSEGYVWHQAALAQAGRPYDSTRCFRQAAALEPYLVRGEPRLELDGESVRTVIDCDIVPRGCGGIGLVMVRAWRLDGDVWAHSETHRVSRGVTLRFAHPRPIVSSLGGRMTGRLEMPRRLSGQLAGYLRLTMDDVILPSDAWDIPGLEHDRWCAGLVGVLVQVGGEPHTLRAGSDLGTIRVVPGSLPARRDRPAALADADAVASELERMRVRDIARRVASVAM
jgi:hypothetical protein